MYFPHPSSTASRGIKRNLDDWTKEGYPTPSFGLLFGISMLCRQMTYLSSFSERVLIWKGCESEVQEETEQMGHVTDGETLPAAPLLICPCVMLSGAVRLQWSQSHDLLSDLRWLKMKVLLCGLAGGASARCFQLFTAAAEVDNEHVFQNQAHRCRTAEWQWSTRPRVFFCCFFSSRNSCSAWVCWFLKDRLSYCSSISNLQLLQNTSAEVAALAPRGFQDRFLKVLSIVSKRLNGLGLSCSSDGLLDQTLRSSGNGF